MPLSIKGHASKMRRIDTFVDAAPDRLKSCKPIECNAIAAVLMLHVKIMTELEKDNPDCAAVFAYRDEALLHMDNLETFDKLQRK